MTRYVSVQNIQIQMYISTNLDICKHIIMFDLILRKNGQILEVAM